MKVYRIEHEEMGSGPTEPNARALADFFEDCDIGETLTVTVCEMEQEDFDALPEWQGF